jgi:Zn-dependent metalloprotease
MRRMDIRSSNQISPEEYGIDQGVDGIAPGEPHPQAPVNRAEFEQAAIAASYRYLASQSDLAGERAESSFRVVHVETDEIGMAHVRMEQIIKGLRVCDQQIITHVDGNGEVQSLTGSYRSDLLTSLINTKPIISREGAIARLRRNFDGQISSAPNTELVIYPTSRGVRLAHRVEFFGETDKGPVRMVHFIDARNGRVLEKMNMIATAQNGAIVPSLAAPNPAFFKPLDLQLRIKSENTNFVERARQRSMSY